MSRFLGFVPVVDDFVEDMPSLYPAYILCYMWTYRTSDNHFDQSIKSMPERLKIAKSTITKWIKWLCDAGYLVDETPDESSKAHIYWLTGKAHIEVNIDVMVTGSKFSHRGDRIVTPLVTDLRSPMGHDTTPMINDHDMMHGDQLKTAITELWQAIGFDLRGLPKMLQTWEEHEGGLKVCLESWLEALNAGAVPETWGAGLVYKKIAAGEMPPEKPRTIGDEVRELMELQNGGEIE